MCNQYTPKQIKNFWKKVVKTDTCWLWDAGKGHTGYGHFTVGNKMQYAHRVAWELTYGAIPNGLLVLHNCPVKDNPSCVNPAHLFLGTHLENARDRDEKVKTGKHTSKLRRLTQSQVDDIRKLRQETNLTLKQIGQRFGICESSTSKIINRKLWA